MGQKYYAGYEKVYQAVQTMSEDELYAQIDCLYGRDTLPKNPTIKQLRDEAIRQTQIDWLDPESESYQMMLSILGGYHD